MAESGQSSQTFGAFADPLAQANSLADGLPSLLIDARRLWQAARRPENHATRVLWAWFLCGFTLLSLSAFKHQHYIMPVLPPLFPSRKNSEAT